jgi:plasmid maintenance system antidote protein VapI
MNRILKSKIIENYGSQFEFSLRLGVHETIVSRIVCGKRTLSPEDQKRWASLLGADPQRLFEQRVG